MRMLAPLILPLFILARSSGAPDAAQAQAQVRAASPWTLAFHDEFDTLNLYDGKPGSGWRTEYGFGGEGTLGSRTLASSGEQEVYADPRFKGTAKTPLGLNPFELHDGVLSIVARKVDPATSAQIWNRPYVSGLLTSKFLFTQQYGYFEFRARLPRGKGLWPALWLVPKDNSWPPEIDVMEGLGDPAVVYMTAHSKAAGKHTSDTQAVKIRERPDDFHVFGLLWDRDQIVWYVDGAEAKREVTPADMNRPMYILLNLAVGGSWPGYPESDFTSARMDIDYVRAWTLDPKAASAPGAAAVPPPSFSGPQPSVVEMLPQAPPAPGQADAVSDRLTSLQAAVRAAMGSGVITREQARSEFEALHQVALRHRTLKYGGKSGVSAADMKDMGEQLDQIESRIGGRTGP